jgi:apolipoprotein D and lipocalin family protein
MKKENWIIAFAGGAAVAAITYSLLSDDIPKGAVPVYPFDKERYLGLWNEIARLPNWIEKDLNQLTEDYTLNEDGSIKVVTKAFNIKKDKWVEVSGRIKSAGEENLGMLKVSYFGPVYLSYNVLDIDEDYKYALASGSGLSYLWILSKETSIPDDIKAKFLTTAKNIGFDISKLEWM